MKEMATAYPSMSQYITIGQSHCFHPLRSLCLIFWKVVHFDTPTFGLGLTRMSTNDTSATRHFHLHEQIGDSLVAGRMELDSWLLLEYRNPTHQHSAIVPFLL